MKGEIYLSTEETRLISRLARRPKLEVVVVGIRELLFA